MTLFDVHVHIGSSDTNELYYGLLDGPEYLSLMTSQGVSRAMAFPPLRTDGYAKANADLVDWCDTTDGRVRAFARIGGDQLPITEPQLWIARRAARAKVGRWLGQGRAPDVDLDELSRYAGVKLLPHLDGVPDDSVFRRINALGLPVLTHAGRYATPRYIGKHILPRVDGRLIVAHLGAFPDREKELKDAVELARSNSRVLLDTSGIWIADFLAYAIREVPEQIIFGSDCPLTTPSTAWALVDSVCTDTALKQRIAHQLAEEVFETSC